MEGSTCKKEGIRELYYLTKEEIAKAAKVVRKTASDIKESHDDKDLENKPLKKLIEVVNNLRYYTEAVEKAKANKIPLDNNKLKNQFETIIKQINIELNKLK